MVDGSHIVAGPAVAQDSFKLNYVTWTQQVSQS